MPDSALVLAAIAGVAYVLWLVLYRFIVRSPLDNLPSPPSSLFLGKSHQHRTHSSAMNL